MSHGETAGALIVGGMLAVGLAGPVVAQTDTPPPASTEAAADVKGSVTREEHLATAEAYRLKASGYRAEAAAHRQMLESYKKRVAVPTDQKTPVENPWIKKMRVHCASFARTADTLATEAEGLAQLHALQAQEAPGR